MDHRVQLVRGHIEGLRDVLLAQRDPVVLEQLGRVLDAQRGLVDFDLFILARQEKAAHSED